MKPQWLKDIYYASIARLTVLNYFWRRAFPKIPEFGRIILHLGCGENYIAQPGFVNIDGNFFRRKDLWLDITLGLPFPEESIDAIFASHVLEHLKEKQVRRVLEEAYRVLKPGGVVRFITPDLGKAIEAYVRGDLTFFYEWPDRRKSIGGRFNNHLLCRDQHRLMFDFSFFKELLEDAGFVNCREAETWKSKVFQVSELEEMQGKNSDSHRSLFVEAFKIER